VDLLSLVPKTDGWVACTAVVLEACALPNGFVTGCAVGADEFDEVPKPNTAFGGGLDGATTARGLDEVTLVGLLVIPKLNFGFDASLVPPAGRALALGLEVFSVDVGGLGFCANAKIFCVELEPIPCGAGEAFEMGLFDGAFACPKENIEGAAEPLASDADEGAVVVVGCAVFVKKVGVVELDDTGPLAAGLGAEVCDTGTGAEGKGNKVLGTAVVVLVSGLSFASLN
jgi:hypothetical protein